MKVPAGRADAFAARPDPAIRAVLVYGPDTGLVAERAKTLLRSVVEDLSDPFRVAEISPAALKDDPARLADEAEAQALTGGRRVVRIRGAGEEVQGACANLLERERGEALVVIEAGDLTPRSKLRQLFEKAGNGAALPCYADDAKSLTQVIHDQLETAGLKTSPEAFEYLVTRLGGDRQVTRSELEKLALYMGGPGTVELDDAIAAVGDTAELQLDDVALCVGDGDQTGLERALDRIFAEGGNAVAILRAVIRHLQRLHYVAGLTAAGTSEGEAVKGLRPPLFFKTADRFRRQLRHWSPQRLATALDLLLEAEAQCKSTGMPDETICRRTCLRIAAGAARAR